MPIASVETTPSRIGAALLVLLLGFTAYDHFPSDLLKPKPAPPAQAQPEIVEALSRVEAAVLAAVESLGKLQPPAPVVPTPVGPVQPIPPAPTDPESLAAAATSYYRTLPSAYHLAAQQVRTRQVKDDRGLRDALSAHSLGLIAALERMFVAACDKNTGEIVDPDGLAATLDSAYAAMGGK